ERDAERPVAVLVLDGADQLAAVQIPDSDLILLPRARAGQSAAENDLLRRCRELPAVGAECETLGRAAGRQSDMLLIGLDVPDVQPARLVAAGRLAGEGDQATVRRQGRRVYARGEDGYTLAENLPHGGGAPRSDLAPRVGEVLARVQHGQEGR